MSDDKPKLGDNAIDKALAVGRVLSSVVPYGLGPVLTELVEQFIPNQRADRVDAYLKYLDAKLQSISDLQSRVQTAEAVELIEEGGFQAARAISEDRRKQLADLVAYGLKGDDAARIEAKRLLDLMRQVDDGQIIILCSHLSRYWRDPSFAERHTDVINSPTVYLASEAAVRDKAAVHEMAVRGLRNLGLIAPRFRPPRQGEAPTMDHRTGMLETSGDDVSKLGLLLLRRLGLAEEQDY